MNKIISYLIIVGSIFSLLMIAVLFTDLKYSVKYWIQSIRAEDTGWQRNELLLDDKTHRLELLSPDLEINGIWPSMTGPSHIHRFSLINGHAPELLWMTAFSTEVYDDQKNEVLDEAYLCHNNLDYSVADYSRYWGLNDRVGVLIPRLVTITQGQTRIEFPKGFGIPLMSDQRLYTATQALNLNEPNLKIKVKHKITIDYVRMEDTKEKFTPLFQQSAVILIKVDSTSRSSHKDKKPDCRPALASLAFLNTREGHKYTGHWIIPTGWDTSSYNVTSILSLKYDTKLHFAGVHVHPYCEYVELTDVTIGETVFKAEVKNLDNLAKMTEIEAYSNKDGKMMYADHKYLLTCVSNNTSSTEQDMMAVMLLYLHDKEMEEIINQM